MGKTENVRSMQNVYGYPSSEVSSCHQCCNCQPYPNKNNQYCCIAYGITNHVNCDWNPYQIGCGLHNKPFYGMTPKRRPLVEIVAPKRRIEMRDDDNQITMF
jgi:hypothetical protein